MYLADLLSNLGGQDLNSEEKKRAVKWGLLNMGAGMLANNQGNYGAFSPVLGQGLQQGLLGYQTQIGREEAGAKQRKQAQLMSEAFKNAIYQQEIPGQETQRQGFSVGGLFSQDKPTADFMAGQNRDINEMSMMPPSPRPQVAEAFPLASPDMVIGQELPGSIMPFDPRFSAQEQKQRIKPVEPLPFEMVDELMRQQKPEAAFEFSKQFPARPGPYVDDGNFQPNPTPGPIPEMLPMEAVPSTVTEKGKPTLGPEQFDMLKAARQLMQSGDPELMQQGFQIYAGLKAGKDESTAEMKNYAFLSALPPAEAEKFMGLLVKDKDNRTSQIKNYEYAIQRGYSGSFDDFLIMTAEAQARIMAPYRQSEMESREQRDAYELPRPQSSAKPQGFSVTAPDGQTYTFPTKKDADNFRMSIGGK